MKIRLKKVHTVPSSIIKFSRKMGAISLFKRITLTSYCFFLTLGENTVMSVCLFVCEDCHLHGYGCIIMQLIVSAHANSLLKVLC